MPVASPFTRFFGYTGGIVILLADAFRYIFAFRFRPGEVIRQAYFLGVQSWPIIVLTSAFTGLVIALETVFQAAQFGIQNLIGGAVAFGELRELGPMLTGIVFAGRAGAAITAQIGAMVVTEQVEALQSMGVSPAKHLVAPRIIACAITVPMLTVLADIIGTYAGWVMAWIRIHLSWPVYLTSIQQMVDMTDFFKGLLKAAVFGLLVAIVACYEGLRTQGGAEGVGVSTTRAVVTSIILIFAFNFALSYVLFTFNLPAL